MPISISTALEQFIALHIQSLEQLDILRLLAKSPEQPLTVSAIFQSIQTNEHSISDRLTKFASAQLVIEESGGYRLSPKHQTTIKELAEAYNQRRVSVIELIYKKPVPPSVREFSEAFRIKKKE
jgi:predicted transcriptional regulator